MIAILGPDASLLLVALLQWLDNMLRYALVAAPVFAFFWFWGRERFAHRLVQGRYPATAQVWREIRYAFSTVTVFAAAGAAVYCGARAHVLRMYLEVGERGWLYLAASIAVLIVVQDAYFYWTHRAMHHPWLYRHVHRVHHLSTNPSPWAAYAFAPAEAAVHAAFVPLMLLWLPLHPLALVVFLTFMIVRNVWGHTSMEFFPRGFVRHRFWRWHTTTTHHNLHHRRVRGNYGLYFTWWDEWMGTTHPDYEQTFDEVTARAAQGPRARVGQLSQPGSGTVLS